MAERELASGRLVRPFLGIAEDVVYTGHWLVFPHGKHYSQSIMVFVEWLAKELGLEVNFASIAQETVALRRNQTGKI